MWAGREPSDAELVGVPYADPSFDARQVSIGKQAYRQLTAQWLQRYGQTPSGPAIR